MRVLKSLLVAVFLLVPLSASAYDVLILQSLREKGYDEAVKGVKRECSATMRTLVLSDYASTDVTRILREEHPRLIIAVGDRALDVASRQQITPVMYLMALNARAGRGAQTGISMLLDPGRYLQVFDSLGARRVGVIGDPARTGPYLKRALGAARRSGIELVVREVHSPKETPAVLDSLRGKIEAIWMLPDLTAVSPASTEAYFLFSQGERVPLVTFAEVYLSMGAAVALGIDRYDIGRQVGEMAQSFLNGTPIEEIQPQSPRRVQIKTNDGVLRQLRISLGGS